MGQPFERPSAAHWAGADSFGPDIMSRIIYGARVALVVGIVAVLIGGALMGIIGALVAIPLAAVVRLLLDEIVFPRLDRS